MDENDKLNGFSKDARKTYFRLIIIQSFFLVIFLIMTMGYGSDSKKIEALVDDISPLVYYRCDNDRINEMLYFFNVFYIYIFCLFIYLYLYSVLYSCFMHYVYFITREQCLLISGHFIICSRIFINF